MSDAQPHAIMPALTTERLELCPFEPADLDELHELFAEPDVRRYLLHDEIMPLEWVEDEIAKSEARFADNGCGLWALRELGGGNVVGFVGFSPFFDPPELQLQYGFLPSHWGRGLATEAASAAIGYAFESLGFEDVRAATNVPNVASIAVLERLGMEEWERTDGGEAGTVFFRVAAEEWLASGI